MTYFLDSPGDGPLLVVVGVDVKIPSPAISAPGTILTSSWRSTGPSWPSTNTAASSSTSPPSIPFCNDWSWPCKDCCRKGQYEYAKLEEAEHLGRISICERKS